jgi:bacterioferritin
MLNKAIAGELQAIIQYMWQHIQWKGIEHYTVSKGFEETAMAEMIQSDVKAELETIALYKEIIEQAQKEGDVATKEIFEEIEEDEEEHHDFFSSLLEK